ncbi:MAG: tetratricopeptide repeat protein, partial [Lentisphaeria bacterium]|nr:tetratricopeptide repeat protein [Lentisphaeria bacterium]
MKHILSSNVWRTGFLATALCTLVLGSAVTAADAPKKDENAPQRARAGADHKELEASRILTRGIELLEAKQEERGVKTLAQITQQYPDTKAAIKAELVLSEYFIEKKQFDEAIKHLLKVQKVEDEEIQADALYKIGICYYNQSLYTQAFSHLRQVVNKFPGSVYANEAYYYIGLCHFKLNRWLPAVDALERVGTSIPQSELADGKGKVVLAESGQRLFIKIYDEDLIVMSIEDDQKQLTVEVSNENGDKETVVMDKLGRDGVTFIGSVPMKPGLPKAGDGTLQVKGGDMVSVNYVDTHTSTGKTDQPMLAKVKLVSTATVGFTNGNYEEYCSGILADQDIFMRVRDLDCDLTPQKDTVKVTVKSIYKKEKPKDELSTGLNFDEEEPEFLVRDTRTYTLTETEERSGVFVGFVRPYFFDPETQLETSDNRDREDAPVEIRPDDLVQIEY